MRKQFALAGCPPHDWTWRYGTEKEVADSGNKQYQVYAVGSIIRRTSSIPAMMPVRMITSISLLRDGMV